MAGFGGMPQMQLQAAQRALRQQIMAQGHANPGMGQYQGAQQEAQALSDQGHALYGQGGGGGGFGTPPNMVHPAFETLGHVGLGGRVEPLREERERAYHLGHLHAYERLTRQLADAIQNWRHQGELY